MIKHPFRQCEGYGGKLCDDCVREMIETTIARSPLAVRIFGLAKCFMVDWGFLPEGLIDETD